MNRPYDEMARKVAALDGEREDRMQAVADVLWDHLRGAGVSWVGFYVHQGGDELLLGPRRDKPACSPIGLHGACGQSFSSGQVMVVRDVADLGEGYIACDPRDRSEVVVPLFEEGGQCWGVLDLDSYEVGSFDETDAAGLSSVLKAAGLTA